MSLINAKFLANIFTQEVPTGTVNGVNDTFTLSASPIYSSAVMLYVNGLLLIQGTHYTITNNTITMTSAPNTGQLLYAVYVRNV